MPDASRIALRTGAELLKSGMQEQFLTGQYLNVRSDRLRSGWQVLDVPDREGWTAVTVSTKVPYAARHEFGFEGHENVREHTRANPKQAAAKRKRAERRQARLWGNEKWKLTREKAIRAQEKKTANRRAPVAAVARKMRREAGLQAGVRNWVGLRTLKEAERTGRIVVRAHGRWARTRARHYARDASERFRPAVEETYSRVLLRKIGLGE